jgi:hypothetical protein
MYFLKLYRFGQGNVARVQPVLHIKKPCPLARLSISSDYARVILPERRQRVQTLTRFTSPSTIARTDWMLGFHAALVWRLEWLTLLPLITPLPQTSQIFAIGFYLLHRISISLIFEKFNKGILSHPSRKSKRILKKVSAILWWMMYNLTIRHKWEGLTWKPGGLNR